MYGGHHNERQHDACDGLNLRSAGEGVFGGGGATGIEGERKRVEGQTRCEPVERGRQFDRHRLAVERVVDFLEQSRSRLQGRSTYEVDKEECRYDGGPQQRILP